MRRSCEKETFEVEGEIDEKKYDSHEKNITVI
jgi:hypothetical protein